MTATLTAFDRRFGALRLTFDLPPGLGDGASLGDVWTLTSPGERCAECAPEFDCWTDANQCRKKPPGERCRWVEDEDGPYRTDCGHTFGFESDGPTWCGCKFCCFCGKPIEEVKR